MQCSLFYKALKNKYRIVFKIVKMKCWSLDHYLQPSDQLHWLQLWEMSFVLSLWGLSGIRSSTFLKQQKNYTREDIKLWYFDIF